MKFERPRLVTEQERPEPAVVEDQVEAKLEGAAPPDEDDEAWRDEVVADIFDGPRPPKPDVPYKDYGDFIAHWVEQKRARDLEDRAKTRRAGRARPGAHVCGGDEEVEAHDLGPNGDHSAPNLL